MASIPRFIEMSFIASHRLRFVLLFWGVLACSVEASARHASAPPATGTFNNVFFKNTTGRVGYHMYATESDWASDLPTGDFATCAPAARDTTTTGNIPPGLVLLANEGPNRSGLRGFDGTPRQPGDWTVSVVINHIMCISGPDQTDYGPKTVVVHFHVDP